MNKTQLPNLPKAASQLIVGKDILGNPFAFLPFLCRIYTLDAADQQHLQGYETTNESPYRVLDSEAIPSINTELQDFLRNKDASSLLRRHPAGIALIVTQSCNLTCSYCLAKQGTFGVPIAKMSIPDIIMRIDELFRLHPDIGYIKFFGGEPTLRMDIIKAVCSHVRDKLGKKVLFALTTNGTGDPMDHYPVWKEFRVNVSVSIDGPRELHDSVRVSAAGKGSFQAASDYCSFLKSKSYPFAVVGVFDERHIAMGISYLDTIKFLNRFSPVVKVQFVEALGDAGGSPAVEHFTVESACSQVNEAVDGVWSYILEDWASPSSDKWIYDNNLYRFANGIIKGRSIPYEHACTASNLTTILPSGGLLPCYTFSELPEYYYGTHQSNSESIEERRTNYRSAHTWEEMVGRGAVLPWYRGIVGDVCVADMINSNDKGLVSSPFYRAFQFAASYRTLQHVASIRPGSIEHAKVLKAMEGHETVTGMFMEPTKP